MKGIVKTPARKRTGACQHRWVIETPHGATSRGLCRRCGATKRFPNAAEDALWESGSGGLGRWANRKPITPTTLPLQKSGRK